MNRRARTTEGTKRPILFLGFFLALVSLLAGCGASGEAGASKAPTVALSVTSGGFTTTVRTGKVTTVPFADLVIVQATFDHAVYGAAGQTAAFATASPASYRVEPHTPRDDRTFTFALRNRTPGTVEVSVFESREAVPVTFTLQIGE